MPLFIAKKVVERSLLLLLPHASREQQKKRRNCDHDSGFPRDGTYPAGVRSW
jgi:hypothetical protein